MLTLDRYIAVRFLASFVLLFMLLFVFAVAIDLILNLDRFVQAARDTSGPEAGVIRISFTLVMHVVHFQLPRLFQFYAFLNAMVAVGAMGFTLAHMHRHRELVAILASGVSLHRVAMPFVVIIFGLSVLQLLNQEYILPKIAPLLLRDHGHIGRQSVREFAVPLTADAEGHLIQAPAFDPRTAVLRWPSILVRDEYGRTVKRIIAREARWEPPQSDDAVPGAPGSGGWRLLDGTMLSAVAEDSSGSGASQETPVEFFWTDVNPDVLTSRQHGQYMAMLSLRQISAMLRTPRFTDRTSHRALLRYRYARFASVLINVLLIWVTLPSFLLREPANLLRQSIQCAALALPLMIGSALLMMVDLGGIAPAVGVFLPVVILGPIALARWTFVRS